MGEAALSSPFPPFDLYCKLQCANKSLHDGAEAKTGTRPRRACRIGPGRSDERGGSIDTVGSIEAAEASIDAFIERRARGAKTGRERANDEAGYWKARDERQTRARQLENAREWASHYGGLALYHHDLAARCAEKRDETLAIVRELEAGHKGGTAA